MVDLPSYLFEEGFHFLLLRHLHGVAGDEELVRQIAEGEFDEGFDLAGAEEDADWRLIAGFRPGRGWWPRGWLCSLKGRCAGN